ncbi:MAG: serine/threonine-protein kinase [Chlamydiota bacterium]
MAIRSSSSITTSHNILHVLDQLLTTPPINHTSSINDLQYPAPRWSVLCSTVKYLSEQPFAAASKTLQKIRSAMQVLQIPMDWNPAIIPILTEKKAFDILRGKPEDLSKESWPLDKGAYGTVSAIKTSTDEVYAIKSQSDWIIFCNEYCNLIKAQNHPNIVKLFHAEKYNQANCRTFHLWMEYLPTNLSKNQDLPEKTILSLFTQVSNAVKYLHEKKIIHRDIKANNILLDQTRTIAKICDFGEAHSLSRYIKLPKPDSTKIERYFKSVHYPPEYRSGSATGSYPGMDIWLFAYFIVWYLQPLSKSFEFPLEEPSLYQGCNQQTIKLLLNAGKIQEAIANELSLIIHPCFSAEPTERPSMEILYTRLHQLTLAQDSPPKPIPAADATTSLSVQSLPTNTSRTFIQKHFKPSASAPTIFFNNLTDDKTPTQIPISKLPHPPSRACKSIDMLHTSLHNLTLEEEKTPIQEPVLTSTTTSNANHTGVQSHPRAPLSAPAILCHHMDPLQTTTTMKQITTPKSRHRFAHLLKNREHSTPI